MSRLSAHQTQFNVVSQGHVDMQTGGVEVEMTGVLLLLTVQQSLVNLYISHFKLGFDTGSYDSIQNHSQCNLIFEIEVRH